MPGPSQLEALEKDIKDLSSLGVALDDSLKELFVWTIRGFAVLSFLAAFYWLVFHE